MKELNLSTNKRYEYGFINCTDCGPRYSIIKSLPYDRENTTMKNLLCVIVVKKNIIFQTIDDFMQSLIVVVYVALH
ncbi:hypothetical protein JTS98_07630 [Clostridium botulinum]|nr:hypothetical protein [Clostridium botulinum]MCS4526180.1 hypothetical protein [Clostridium botulinum]